MAIFGDLSEMSLAELLPVLSRGTGQFIVWSEAGQRHYDLHIRDGVLISISINSECTQDIFQVRNQVVELVTLRRGEFEFRKTTPAALRSDFALSLEVLVLLGVAAANEIDSFRPHFPSPETIFVAQANDQVWLKTDLQEFWDSARSLLEVGASATQISNATGVFLDQVLFFLYQLRATGLVVPVRAFDARRPRFPLPHGVSRPVPNTPPRLIGHYVEPEITLNPDLAISEKGGSLKKVRIARMERGLLSRMLNGLQVMFSISSL